MRTATTLAQADISQEIFSNGKPSPAVVSMSDSNSCDLNHQNCSHYSNIMLILFSSAMLMLVIEPEFLLQILLRLHPVYAVPPARST